MSKKRKKKKGQAKAAVAAVAAVAADLPEGAELDVPVDATDAIPVEPAAAPRTAYDAFRENAEALLVAVILAIIIRHFAVEAFEIPTGSMATTLYGIHAHFECPNCDHEFDCGLSSDSSTSPLHARYDSMVVVEEECPDEECTLALHAHGPPERGRARALPLQEGGEVLCLASGRRFTPKPESYRQTAAFTANLRCPLCHLEWRGVVERSNHRGGDKILVNKFAFQAGEPQRFDVIVFGFDQWKNYIKRLIGKPGERIDLIDGDIYVNGEIVRKSEVAPDVQNVLWRKISDSDQLERGVHEKWASRIPGANARTDLNARRAEPWIERGGQAVQAWERLDDGRWSLNNPASKEPAVLEYNASRGFDNFVAYNTLVGGGGDVRGHAPVGDMKLAFRVNPTSGRGWVGAELRDGQWTFRVQIPVGQASESFPAKIERVENQSTGPDVRFNPLKLQHKQAASRGWVSVHPELFVPFNEETNLEFEICDDRVVLRMNGEEAMPPIAYRSVSNVDDYIIDAISSRLRNAHYVAILGSDVQANVASIQVYQDIFYINNVGRSSQFYSIQLEEGQYFALGDNSPLSSDGRAWGYVPEHNLMGRALLVFWPATPWEFRWKFIR